MRNSLSRKLLVMLAAVMLAGESPAQYTGHAVMSRMRAVGILRIDATGKARLFPITLFADGKYYDARFYEANPVPFALAGDIYYQVQKDGKPEGSFLVQTAFQSPSQWWAEGKWSPTSGESRSDASKPAAHTADEDRPVLRHAAPPSSPPTSRPEAESKTASAPSDAAEQAEEQDPGRPTLRHGKSEQVQPDVSAGRLAGAPISTAAAPAVGSDRVLLAVADAGKVESRPYGYNFAPGERERDMEALKHMAADAIRQAARQRAGLRGTEAAQMTDAELYAFDPDYSNRPVLVFSTAVDGAKGWPPAGSASKVAITLVARKDAAGRLNKIFQMIADPTMLDVRPMLRFLGAVDADGSGRAQLLFREQVDVHSYSYVLYRATPYDLIKTFETKAAEE